MVARSRMCPAVQRAATLFECGGESPATYAAIHHRPIFVQMSRKIDTTRGDAVLQEHTLLNFPASSTPPGAMPKMLGRIGCRSTVVGHAISKLSSARPDRSRKLIRSSKTSSRSRVRCFVLMSAGFCSPLIFWYLSSSFSATSWIHSCPTLT